MDRSSLQARWRRWPLRILSLAPALIVCAVAGAHFKDGAALEAAAPQIAYIQIDDALSAQSYGTAAAALTQASSADGEAALLRAEALLDGGASSDAALAVARTGIAAAPGSARGWITLARILGPHNPKDGAAALSIALMLARHDYYLIAPRAEAGAMVWPELSAGARAQILDDASRIVADPEFHAALAVLLKTSGGPALLTRVFKGNPDALRAFNRNLARERLGL